MISCVWLRKFKESALLVVINVHAPHRPPLHDQMVSVCVVCISAERRIINPTFFYPLIDLERYTTDILFALSAQLDEGEINYYFQQDGSCAHRVRNSTAVSSTTTFLFRGSRKGKGLWERFTEIVCGVCIGHDPVRYNSPDACLAPSVFYICC